MVLEGVIRKSCRKAPLERDALPRRNSAARELDRGYHCRQQLHAVPKNRILSCVSCSSLNATQTIPEPCARLQQSNCLRASPCLESLHAFRGLGPLRPLCASCVLSRSHASVKLLVRMPGLRICGLPGLPLRFSVFARCCLASSRRACARSRACVGAECVLRTSRLS